MTTTRLIERWLPIAEIGIEGVRERTPMTPFPAPNRLHVWWARRPLVASRAAVLASILPENADHAAFKHALGIHGDPVRGVALIDRAKRTGQRVDDPYGYERAFKYSPKDAEMSDLSPGKRSDITILDATAGGGAIPFEAIRLGFSAISNDLNPVASLLQTATIEYPTKFGAPLGDEFDALMDRFRTAIGAALHDYVPQPNAPDEVVTSCLWARTITCPYCAGIIPLSPAWRLAPDGTGVKITTTLGSGPGSDGRICSFEMVTSAADQTAGTVANAEASCVFEDCGRVISGAEVKRQAQAGEMGDQLFGLVVKRKTVVKTKSGGNRTKWVRAYRAPIESDHNNAAVAELLDEKSAEWAALDLVPNEAFPSHTTDNRFRQYSKPEWRDMFSPRQFYAHGMSVEVFRALLEEDQAAAELSEIRRAAYVYLAIAIDKLLDYNSRISAWHAGREVLEHTFRDHVFVMKWSYAEMAMLADGLGYDWALQSTSKALKELISLTSAGKRGDLLDELSPVNGQINILNGSGAAMFSVPDKSVDAVVMDPPYGANVMYAELSDFFYVWLKRTAGLVVPGLFTRGVSDKDAEAVANKSLFQGQKGSAKLAQASYREKMAAIFEDCRRVLKDDGVLTVMFTHKETGAWDALALSLIDAGFVITASWPINTEASGSLHIKDKAAANSTIFLVCRPREDKQDEAVYWEDVEPEVAKAVRARVGEYQEAGISGVDLYLASFGPALEAFSRHWPLTRGTPAPEPKKKRRAQGDMFEEFDPYAVRPEDALNAARREVKAWRLAQLASAKAQADMDGPTAFYVLAWDAFKAVSFPYDEALRLSRAVGVDLEEQVVGRLAEKKGSEIKLWDSATRVAKGAIGPADGVRGMIDALHHAAHTVRVRGVEAAVEQLANAGIGQDDEFKVALEALLEVLPPSKTFSGIEADKAIKPAADDFDALETLRRIAYENEIGEPQQLELYREMMAAE